MIREAEGERKQVEVYLADFCHYRAELFHRVQHFKYYLLKKIMKRLRKIQNQQSPGEDDVQLVKTLLSDRDWMKKVGNDSI